jgi:hypothetical protein
VTDSNGKQATSSGLSFTAYSTSATYLFEGASLAELDHGYYAGVSYWWFNTTLTTSPYATMVQFAGLTNKGDWFQTIVGYNWPGCNSGFEMEYASWNSAGSNVAYNCDSGVTLSSGDNVGLILYVSTSGSTSGDACMEVYDWTHSTSATECLSQPDGGSHASSNYFEVTSTALNSNGYFTGPLTEALSNTACASFSSMPDISYGWTAGTHISEYFAWSQESDSSSCYSYTSPLLTMPVNYHNTQYTQSAPSYGPHWESAQNTSNNNPSTWWVFSTDNAPSNPATTSISGSTTDQHGHSDTMTPSTTGGTGSMTYLWYVNGVYSTSTTGAWSWTPSSSGTYTITCYTEDGSGNYYGQSNTITVTVS